MGIPKAITTGIMRNRAKAAAVSPRPSGPIALAMIGAETTDNEVANSLPTIKTDGELSKFLLLNLRLAMLNVPG
jgi:hypothetical protein